MRLKDHTAIVTGAASGIGRAIAIRFASAGAYVLLADLSDAPRTEGHYRASRGTVCGGPDDDSRKGHRYTKISGREYNDAGQSSDDIADVTVRKQPQTFMTPQMAAGS